MQVVKEAVTRPLSLFPPFSVRSRISGRPRRSQSLGRRAYTSQKRMFRDYAAHLYPFKLHSPAPIATLGPWAYYRPERIASTIAAMESYKIPVLILSAYSDDRSIWR